MPVTLFKGISGGDREKTLEKLICYSLPAQDLVLMAILSIMMANFGFLLENIAIIIGSMLIAPIIYPILSLGMALVMLDFKLFLRSLSTLLIFAILGVAVSLAVTYIFQNHPIDFSEGLISQIQPSGIYIAVAFVAGLAASFSLVKPELNEMFPGVAIAVTLIPPLAVIGLALAKGEWLIVRHAAELFGTNAAGIVVASIIIFSFMRFRVKKKVAKKVLQQEEKELANGEK